MSKVPALNLLSKQGQETAEKIIQDSTNSFNKRLPKKREFQYQPVKKGEFAWKARLNQDSKEEIIQNRSSLREKLMLEDLDLINSSQNSYGFENHPITAVKTLTQSVDAECKEKPDSSQF